MSGTHRTSVNRVRSRDSLTGRPRRDARRSAPCRDAGIGVAVCPVIMIPGTSSMDRPVERSSPFTRNRLLALAAVAALLLVGGMLALPALRRFVSAERSVDARTLRFGKVTKGELRREVSVQGKVVAALHPT